MTALTRRIIPALLLAALFFTSACADGGKRYTDSEIGISFEEPAGWTAAVPEEEYIIVEYTVGGDDGMTSVTFSYFDMWEGSDEKKQGIAREDMDFSCLSEDEIVEMMADDAYDSIEVKTYGSNSYYMLRAAYEQEFFGFSIAAECEYAVTLIDGCAVVFCFCSYGRFETDHPAFEAMLASLAEE